MKTIRFRCPVCNQHFEASPETAGQPVKCPSCETGFVPPAPWKLPKFPKLSRLPAWLIPGVLVILGSSVIIWLQLGELLLWPAIGGAIGAAIGEQKKQILSGVVWGAFLGPIGWILVYFMPDLRPKCPECLAPIDPAARKCRHCGAAITGIPAAQKII